MPEATTRNSPSPATAPAVPRAESATVATRDRFLDLLRMVSVLRVIALHTFTKPPLVYFPWIQWIFPGMPEVFFVSGAVTARALRGRPSREVVLKRLRRLFPPFYLYAVVALTVMVATDRRSTAPNASLDRGDWFSFLVPLVRPTGSETRVILWGHLWFLTAFFWVIGLAGVTYWVHRRIGAWSTLIPALGFAGAVAAEKLAHVPVREEIYHVTMFGWFFQLGYLYDDRVLQRWRPRVHVVFAAVIGFAGWLVAQRIEPVWRKPLNELYSSQTGHFLVGASWMFLAFAFRRPISDWLARRRAVILDVVTRRTYTLFIWGPAANAVARAASHHLDWSYTSELVGYLVITVIVLLGFVLAFGWVEDWASGRKVSLVPW